MSEDTLTKLRLRNTNLNIEALPDIIGSSQKLTEFQVELFRVFVDQCYRLVDSDHPFDVDTRQLVAALSPHKEPFTLLELSNVNNHNIRVLGWGTLQGHQRAGLGSLVDFTALKSLAVDEYLLKSSRSWKHLNLVPVLPASLEHLTVHAYENILQLSDIASSFAQYIGGALVDVSITFDYSLSDDNLDCETWLTGDDSYDQWPSRKTRDFGFYN